MKKANKIGSRKSRLHLDEWLKHSGITADALADAIGMTRGAVSKLRTGAQRYNQDALERIADHFDCHPIDLLMPPAEAIALRAIREKFSPDAIDKISVAIELIMETTSAKS